MPRKNGNKASDATEGNLAYIPCRVEPGMFREELLAFVEARDPENLNKVVKAQLLVDQREVAGVQGTPKRNNPVSGWLRVSIAGARGDWVEVVLPQPSQPLGDIILVGRAAVREEPGP